MGSNTLEFFHERLDWPSAAEITAPKGPGAAVYARLARRKLGQPLRLQSAGGTVRVCVLAKNPQAEDSEAPLGLLLPDSLVSHSRETSYSFLELLRNAESRPNGPTVADRPVRPA
jgi:hypothetical protein